MRDLGHLQALGALGLDKAVDQLLWKYAARGEIIVVGLQRIQRLGKRGGRSLLFSVLFRAVFDLAVLQVFLNITAFSLEIKKRYQLVSENRADAAHFSIASAYRSAVSVRVANCTSQKASPVL